MSKEYDLYLQEHKANVKKGFEWIRENLPELILYLSILELFRIKKR